MDILSKLRISIDKVGIKEVARRAALSPSTVSRISAGLINPSFEVVTKISAATGFYLELRQESIVSQAPRLSFAKNILGRLRNELKSLGVKHAFIFGSVARKEDDSESDIDLYLEFSEKISASRLLKAEGIIIDAFGKTKIDIVSQIKSQKGQRLLQQIMKDGIYVF